MFKTATSKIKLSASIGDTASSSDLSTASASPSMDWASPPTIADLICDREWSLLEGLLMSDGASLSIDDTSRDAEHAITENIVVHFAVRCQAPLRTVSLLSKLCPASITSPDKSGRYPIHVACKWSATPDVISYLVGLNSSTCGIQDNFGKTPLHYVAGFYIANYQDPFERLYSMDQSMMEVVKLLISAAPTSVNLDDNEGCNAIEYALENDVHFQVFKYMQRACRDDWRQRSKASDDGRPRRHSDLMKELEELTMNLQEEVKNSHKDLEFVHSVLTESKAASSRPRRRGSMLL